MKGIEQYLQVDLTALGALIYQGTWNASTNTPTLTSSVGTQGYYYVVSVAGSTNLNGETNWGVGDWAVFNGSVWQKVDGGSTGNFTSVTISGLTASKPVFTDANKNLVSTGTLGADQGGTGLTSYTAGDLPYASAATTISKLAIGAANTVLTSSGTAPQWSTSLTLSGNVTAAGLIPSSSTVPTNGVFLPAANSVGISTNNTERARIDASGYLLVGTTTNTNTSQIVANGTISETVSSVQYLVASQYDVGTAPNEIPLNQYLGKQAYLDVPQSASPIVGMGYLVGAGSAVTQITSRTTGVTINTPTGQITLVSAAGTTTYQTFTVTNSSVGATDTIIVNQASGTDLNIILVTNVAAGSFKISFATTGGTTTEQPVFNFAVIKGSNI